MELAHLLSQVLFATVGATFVVALAGRAVRLAKRGTAGAHVLGAAFLFFSMGNMRDPTDDVVQQAKQLKRRNEDGAGDPAHGDDDEHNGGGRC
ncbi:MAG TPA: hypothetical protein VFJ95_02305 [Gammaproteobacteria bacterium]|nr:hypothetical protein [Gammaproteobacteria bacterium]